MKHTQEQLAAVLNNQYKRGLNDAKLHRDYGHDNESASYPNAAWPDISRKAAYNNGWAFQRRKMNKPDSICVEVFGKGVKHELS